MSGECTVTPGFQFAPSDPHTTANTNLLAIPQVSVSAKAITDTEIADAGISKIAANSVDVGDLTAAVQAKFGYKNYCYNPSFWHWTAGTSFTSGTTNADYWVHTLPAISYTISRQALIAGENDTLLRQSKYYWRIATSGTSATGSSFYSNQIKNPRLFSGQQITISAVVKVSSGTLPTLSFFVEQNFGTGGSPSGDVRTTVAANAQPSASWTRIYATINVPTVSGKTFGSTTDGEIRFGYSLANSSTIYQLDVANVQVELGDAATTFEDVNGQTLTNSTQIVIAEANLPQKSVAVGSGLGVDSRGAYWKPNVVQTVKSDKFTTTSTSFTALTGLSASITPTSTSSRILVEVVIVGGVSGGGYGLGKVQRNGTDIGVGDAAGSRARVGFPFVQNAISGWDSNASITTYRFLDTPASTSSQTYAIQCRVTSTTLVVNSSATDTDSADFGRFISTIILTEIPA